MLKNSWEANPFRQRRTFDISSSCHALTEQSNNRSGGSARSRHAAVVAGRPCTSWYREETLEYLIDKGWTLGLQKAFRQPVKH
ncbi:TPA: hypothetical protein ACH3X2_008389 [Trebouxia sp. C0005]